MKKVPEDLKTVQTNEQDNVVKCNAAAQRETNTLPASGDAFDFIYGTSLFDYPSVVTCPGKFNFTHAQDFVAAKRTELIHG